MVGKKSYAHATHSSCTACLAYILRGCAAIWLACSDQHWSPSCMGFQLAKHATSEPNWAGCIAWPERGQIDPIADHNFNCQVRDWQHQHFSSLLASATIPRYCPLPATPAVICLLARMGPCRCTSKASRAVDAMTDSQMCPDVPRMHCNAQFMDTCDTSFGSDPITLL